MLVTWRRWLKASAAIVLVGLSVACSSSSGSSSEPSPTLVTVAPSTFGQGVVCGEFPGAWKTYVATLTDVTDPAKPFVLPSSNPVPCTMPVSFAWVIPDHKYTAQVEGYDRSDLVPAGGLSSGSPHMVDPSTLEDVEPRWKTQCGVTMTIETDAGVPTDADTEAGTDADTEAGADADTEAGDADAGAEAEAATNTGPTTAVLQTNVLVQYCDGLRELLPSGDETGILLDLATVHGDLVCGEQPGDIARLKVIPEDPSLSPENGTCDETFTYAPLVEDRTYRFRVEAFEATGATAKWASTCEARTKKGITLPALCNTLSDRGALRIDIDALVAAAAHTCSAEDVVSYRAVLLGSSLGTTPLSCNTDALFNALAPAAYQAVVEGFDAEGEQVFDAFCSGAVKSAATTTMDCEVGSK
jgi:hypothetical protein